MKRWSVWQEYLCTCGVAEWRARREDADEEFVFSTWQDAYTWALEDGNGQLCHCGLGTALQCATEPWGCAGDDDAGTVQAPAAEETSNEHVTYIDSSKLDDERQQQLIEDLRRVIRQGIGGRKH